MYLSDLFVIVCLLTSINVCLGYIENKENELGSEPRIVVIETQSHNVSRIETYYEKKQNHQRCPKNPNGICLIQTLEKKERIVWRIENKTMPIYRCRDGYKLHDDFCLPNCTCANGICISPQQCKCSKGYENDKNDPLKCSPVCDECVHGECISPNYCSCSDGYQWNGGQTNKCIPICFTNYYFNDTLELCMPKCEPPCIFGECIGPNECKCIDNYQLEQGSTNECKPICNPKCVNGICIDGAQFKNGSSKECDQHSENGKYVSTNECKCLNGYQFKNASFTDCEPKCKEICVNGKCIEPDKCECNDGYQFKSESTNLCEPICEPECANGKCIKPNVCECNDNYEKSSNQSATNICCPICGFEFGKDCASTNCIIDYCECAENLEFIRKDDTTITEYIVDSTTDTSTTEQSTSNLLNEIVSTESTDDDEYTMPLDVEKPVKAVFNWWSIVVALSVIMMIILFGFGFYKNRKIDYNMGDDTQASIHYWKNP
ncbi:protein draper-like [Contarinia nasturtii]|uniref:protein draper-like n=1 Tax=Contarinia nasturtii TaxID=265458 RepID=UPI0012D39283|nr:protein draper-like [Contarinia nasturtii]